MSPMTLASLNPLSSSSPSTTSSTSKDREPMSKIASLDPHLRLLVALAAKLATLGILVGRYPASASITQSHQKQQQESKTDDGEQDGESHSKELANEQEHAAKLMSETVNASTLWLQRVVKHLGIDLETLPEQHPGKTVKLDQEIDEKDRFDVVFELVLVSVGLAEDDAQVDVEEAGGAEGAGSLVNGDGVNKGSKQGKKKPKKGEDGQLVYSSLDRTLVVRTAAILGITASIVRGAEKSIAQMLFFQFSQEESKKKGDGGKQVKNAWDEAAAEQRQEAKTKGNVVKWAATGAGFILGGVAIGLTGGLAAPAIAPLLAGGLGIAAFSGASGAILIGTLLGLGGGGLAGYRTHRRMKGLDELAFEQLRTPDVPEIPTLTATIVASGFLLDLSDSVEPWRSTFERTRSDTFALKADTKDFLSAGRALDKFVRNKVIQMGGVEIIKTSALAALYAGVALPLTVFQGATAVLDSDFARCRDKAKMAGILLAEILEKKVQGSRPCNLIGYGPGATIIFEALLELHRRELGSLVYDAVLVALPSEPNAVKWASVRSVVAHRLVNCYSTNDWLLAINARLYSLAARVAGLRPVLAEGVENIDCSDLVGGHLELRGKMKEILERVDDQPSPPAWD
ncbi:DUF726-domain-containing protein [Meredithblackwellia eburnea MCA 4105]